MPDWNTLIDEHGPLVVRISWRILGNAADVEDNVQEVFFQAYRLHAKTEVRHWRGLLRRLATLGALAKLRRRRQNVSLDGLDLPGTEGLPEDGLIRKELAAELRRAIAGLPEREGAVFALRYLEGLTLAEVAESLQITYQATATALSRARAKLEGVFSAGVREEE